MAGQSSGTDPRRLRRARVALLAVFFVNGSLFGNWASRIPSVKEHVDVGTGGLGLALLGIAVGALVSKQISGQLVARLGSAPVTRVGVLLSCFALILPGLADNGVTLGLALVGFGAAMGILDVAMNAHGVTMEEKSGRPVLSFLHAAYSVGGLVGAVAGGWLAAERVSSATHFTLVAVVTATAALAVSPWLLPSALDATARGGSGVRWVRVPRDKRLPLFLLAFAGLCAMAGEGAIGDWSALYLRDDLGQSAQFASYGYAVYSITMAAGRLVGDRVVARWGGLRVAMCSVVSAGAVFAVALASGNPVVALCGFGCLGIGLSVVMPVIFSTAGRLGGERTGPAITLVSSISGTGFLMGPPIIGFLAQVVGLPRALSAVSLLAVASAILMYAVKVWQPRAVPSAPPPMAAP
ncbi:MFS transporter [Plantactinospora sp. CA-290183]|uniref:MFS transporter n=1 Tax=Plantactinospora sp. CA-290183 TaxID=3240006 RepID=UPI003D8D1B09